MMFVNIWVSEEREMGDMDDYETLRDVSSLVRFG